MPVKHEWETTRPWNTTGRRSSNTCMSRLMIRDAVNDMLARPSTATSTWTLPKTLAKMACPPHRGMRTRSRKGWSSATPQKMLIKDIMSFERISKSIEDNGGRIAELDDPKLTHVVLDKRDDSRRRELMKRTSKYGNMCITYFSPLRSSCGYTGQSTEI
jgi:hypothetical protein